jgi:Skp family chaperone for outer membrane proteins
MFRSLIWCVCFVVVSAAPAFAQLAVTPATRIAYFSPSRAFAESSDGKAATARLTVLESERAKAAQEKNLALEKMERTLQQGTSVLSDAARDLRTKELEKFRLDTQRFIEDTQAELTGVRRDAESAFLVKLRPAMERVIKDNAIELLFNFDSGVLVWGDPSLDVTNQILKLIEAEPSGPQK